MSVVIDDNNDFKWSDDIEWVLDRIRFNSETFAKEHKKRYLYLKNTLKYYRIPIIILSAINSVVSVGAQPFFIQETISLTNCILSLLCGIIGSIELFFGIQNQMENEMNSSKEFYILSTDIFKTTSLLRPNRQIDGITFLNDSYSKYKSLVETSCIIKKKIEDRLKPLKYDKGNNTSGSSESSGSSGSSDSSTNLTNLSKFNEFEKKYDDTINNENEHKEKYTGVKDDIYGLI